MENDVVVDETVIEDKPDPLAAPEVQLAIERGKNEVLERLAVRPKQDEVTGVLHRDPDIPANPMDLLSLAEREELRNMRIENPDKYENTMAALASKHAQMKLERSAAPMIQGQANMIVRAFKADRRSIDMGKFEKIEPIFDASLRGRDLRGLTTMSESQQNDELRRWWMAAKAEVLEKEPQIAPRQEARLVSGDGPGVAPKAKVLADSELPEDIRQLKEAYKFTDEQIAVIMDERIMNIAQAGW